MINHNSILIIDDESQIRKILSISLDAYGYKVFEAASGREGLTLAAINKPGLIILDLGLPDIPGEEVIRNLRTWNSVPIIILSVKNSEDDIVNCLDLGADDYLTKPFNTLELLARIRANIRRITDKTETPIYIDGPLKIDFTSRVVKKNGIEIKLTATEYSFLVLLIKNAGKVLTHRNILKEVWGNTFTENDHYPRIYVGHLRKKIEDNPSEPKWIVTESGVGYRFIPMSR